MKIKFRDPVSKDFFELVNGNYITSLSPLQVNCFKEGKNLYKGINITGFTASVGAGYGAISVDSTGLFRFAFVEIEPNTTYTISTNGKQTRFRIFTHNSIINWNDKPVKFDTMVTSSSPDDTLSELTFTSGGSTVALYILYSNSGDIDCELQVEKGDAKTPYKPYGLTFFDKYIDEIVDNNSFKLLFENYIKEKDNAYKKLYIPSFEIPYDKYIANTQYSDICNLYDELMASNPTYITKEKIGTTTYGNIDIYCYKFTPETINYTNFDGNTGVFNSTGNPRKIKTRKKLICLSGTHGDERSTVVGLYNFLKEVVNNPSKNKLLERVREELELIVVPVVNPTAYNENSRFSKNSSGNNVIDMNRLFLDKYLTSDDYSDLALSEVSTIINLLKSNLDASVAIDFHNMQKQKGKNLSWFIMDGDDIEKNANEALIKCSKNWQERFPFLEQDKGMLFGETSNSDMIYPDNPAYTIQRFAHNLGLNALTLEFTTTIDYNNNNSSYIFEQLNLHFSLIGNIICSFLQNDSGFITAINELNNKIASILDRIENLENQGGTGGGTTIPVTGISLSTSTLNLIEGNSSTLTAIISPTNATNQNVVWSTNDSSVATVSNGVVTAVSAGSATITASTVDGNYTANCSITVDTSAVVAGSYVTEENGNRLMAEDGSYLITD